MKRVTGPVAYQKIVIRSYNDKVIHLFGDIHSYHTECIQQDTDIVSLIHDTLRFTKDTVIDVFVEQVNGGYFSELEIQKQIDERGKVIRMSDGYLQETIDFLGYEYNAFITPIQEYSRLSFPHRFHNVDFRMYPYHQIKMALTSVFGFDESELYEEIYENNFTQEDLEDEGFTIEEITELLSPEEHKSNFKYLSRDEEKFEGKWYQFNYIKYTQTEIIEKVMELITECIDSNKNPFSDMKIQFFIWMDYFLKKYLFSQHPYINHITFFPLKEQFEVELLNSLITIEEIVDQDGQRSFYVENNQQITYRMKQTIQTRFPQVVLPKTFSYIKLRLYKSIEGSYISQPIQMKLKEKVDHVWTRMVQLRRDKKFFIRTYEVIPIIAELMNLYVVIRLCKPYIRNLICYTGVAHLEPISDMLRDIYGSSYEASIFYGDINAGNESKQGDFEEEQPKIIQCVSIPLVEVDKRPILDFTDTIYPFPNQAQYKNTMNYSNAYPFFEYQLKKGVPMKRNYNIIKYKDAVDTRVMDIDYLFRKYGIPFDKTSPNSIRGSIRKLLGFLHPDKNKESETREERELDYKTVSNFYVTNNLKGTKKQSKRKSICWKGYHRVKGKKPYSKKSCVKNK